MTSKAQRKELLELTHIFEDVFIQCEKTDDFKTLYRRLNKAEKNTKLEVDAINKALPYVLTIALDNYNPDLALTVFEKVKTGTPHMGKRIAILGQLFLDNMEPEKTFDVLDRYFEHFYSSDTKLGNAMVEKIEKKADAIWKEKHPENLKDAIESLTGQTSISLETAMKQKPEALTHKFNGSYRAH